MDPMGVAIHIMHDFTKAYPMVMTGGWFMIVLTT